MPCNWAFNVFFCCQIRIPIFSSSKIPIFKISYRKIPIVRLSNSDWKIIPSNVTVCCCQIPMANEFFPSSSYFSLTLISDFKFFLLLNSEFQLFLNVKFRFSIVFWTLISNWHLFLALPWHLFQHSCCQIPVFWFCHFLENCWQQFPFAKYFLEVGIGFLLPNSNFKGCQIF